MKRFMIVLTGFLMFTVSAHSNAFAAPAPVSGDLQQKVLMPCMMTGQPGQLPPNCPMLNQQGGMPAAGGAPMTMMCPMNDMLQSMIDMMKMQQKLLAGVKPAEKKALMQQMETRLSQAQQQIAGMRNMPMPCLSMPCMQPAPAQQQGGK